MFAYVFMLCGFLLVGESVSIPKHDRIVGGNEISINKMPSIVSVQYLTSHVCGGSIINNRTVLTAAQCVQGKWASSMTVVAGTTIINNITTPGSRYFIREILIHDEFNATSYENDIAILRLTKDIVYNEKIQAISLAEENFELPASAGAKIYGWGATEEGGQVTNTLREAVVAGMHFNVCQGKYGSKITKKMLCCQTAGRDACQGDAGGPLVFSQKQVGLFSWHYGCARKPYPGVYTSIPAARTWIDKNIY